MKKAYTTFALGLLCLFAMPAYSQFAGTYDPSNWTTNLTPGGDGSVDVSGAPAAITIFGSDNGGPGGYEEFTIPVSLFTFISFNYSHLNPDIDDASYTIDGVEYHISSGGTGSFEDIIVNPGQVFGFRVNNYDNCCGRGELTISSFKAVSLFTFYPSDTTVCENSDVLFTVGSINATSFEWQVDQGSGFTALSNTSPYSGVNTDTLHITAAGVSMGGYLYRCQATDGIDTANSAAAALAIDANPAIIIQPFDSFACEGGNASFSISATGKSLTYLWQVDSGSGFSDLTDTLSYSGSTSNMLNVTGAGSSMNGYLFRCQVSGECGSPVSSDSVLFTVNTVIVSAIASDTVICDGDPLTLHGEGTDSYSWDNGVTDSVTFNPAASAVYTVTGTDLAGCTATASVSITVNQLPLISANVTDISICPGDSVILTGSGGISYSWNKSVIDSIPFYPSVTDIYTVIGLDTNGCSNMDNITVTVNVPQQVVALSSDSTVCPGDSLMLTGTGSMIYTWNNGITDGISFVPDSTMTYIVSATDSNGCASVDSITVIVNEKPSLVISSNINAACIGDSLVLTATGTPGIMWDNGVTDGLPFQPAATLTYTVTGTDLNGCTATSSIEVPVNPLPSVMAWSTVSIVCAGDYAILYGTGASTYLWNKGVFNTVAFVPVSSGYYILTGVDTNGCTGADSIKINVNPLPSVSVTAPVDSVCLNSGIFALGITPAGGTLSGNGIVGQIFVPETAGLGTHEITYTVTDSNGCTNTDTTYITVHLCLGISESSKLNVLNVYPNPATDVINISSSGKISGFTIYSVTGQVVKNITMQAANKTAIDISNLSPGFYVLGVQSGNNVQFVKIFKARMQD